MVLELILQSIYYFLPAYCANMAPVIFKHVNILPQRVDFGAEFQGKPLFGSHKTWGGLLYATLTGTLIFLLQQHAYTYTWIQDISLINYSQTTLWLGLLLGIGAILGDLAESFVKRRLDRKSGAPFVPFDQTDFVLGGLILSAPLFLPAPDIIITLLIITPALSLGANSIGYLLGLKDVWW